MNPRPRLKEPDKSAEVPHQKMERHSHIAAYSRSRPFLHRALTAPASCPLGPSLLRAGIRSVFLAASPERYFQFQFDSWVTFSADCVACMVPFFAVQPGRDRA